MLPDLTKVRLALSTGSHSIILRAKGKLVAASYILHEAHVRCKCDRALQAERDTL